MDVDRTAGEILRQQNGRILATLIRLSGSFDLAEEAMQDAFAPALVAWATDGGRCRYEKGPLELPTNRIWESGSLLDGRNLPPLHRDPTTRRHRVCP